MSAAEMTERMEEQSAPSKARTAGLYYLVVFLTGGLSLFVRGWLGLAASLVAGICYIVVTLLFYEIFKPVNRNLSLVATLISLAGILIGPLNLLHLAPSNLNPLVFFGFYCLLIGYLIFKSTFLPRVLGVLMAFGGLGWLTFLSPPLAKYLSPYNFFPGLLGEGALTLWLVAKGVDVQRWNRPKSNVQTPTVAPSSPLSNAE